MHCMHYVYHIIPMISLQNVYFIKEKKCTMLYLVKTLFQLSYQVRIGNRLYTVARKSYFKEKNNAMSNNHLFND